MLERPQIFWYNSANRCQQFWVSISKNKQKNPIQNTKKPQNKPTNKQTNKLKMKKVTAVFWHQPEFHHSLILGI